LLSRRVPTYDEATLVHRDCCVEGVAEDRHKLDLGLPECLLVAPALDILQSGCGWSKDALVSLRRDLNLDRGLVCRPGATDGHAGQVVEQSNRGRVALAGPLGEGARQHHIELRWQFWSPGHRRWDGRPDRR